MSTLNKLLSILFFISCARGLVAEPNGYQFEKQFVLFDSYRDPSIVPENRIWKIDKLPAIDQSGVGTADIFIEGQMYVGESQGCTIYGKFDVIFSKKQLLPLWLLESTLVKVGDSRDKVTVRQYIADPKAEIAKINLLKKARAGNTEAQNTLAWYYEKGIKGCAFNEEKSLYWRCKAALHGESNALITIELHFPDRQINCLEIVRKGEPAVIPKMGWKPYSPIEQ